MNNKPLNLDFACLIFADTIELSPTLRLILEFVWDIHINLKFVIINEPGKYLIETQ